MECKNVITYYWATTGRTNIFEDSSHILNIQILWKKSLMNYIAHTYVRFAREANV